jgi:hypothetical protein
MPRHIDDDDFDDEFDDYGEEDSLDEPTLDCPYCGREILEVLIQCPGCGNYLSKEDTLPRRQAPWIIIAAVLVLAGIAITIFRF